MQELYHEVTLPGGWVYRVISSDGYTSYRVIKRDGWVGLFSRRRDALEWLQAEDSVQENQQEAETGAW